MNKIRIALFLLISTCYTASLFAQYGYSSGSLSMGKMWANSRVIPVPDAIVLEEYFNYHHHAIRIPKGNAKVALDLQWGGSPLTLEDDQAILQVGIATQKAASLAELPPVNVTLVIDKSGSMRGDRIAKAREAAHAFVKRLRPKDILSIVAFDNGVDVVFPAQKLDGKAKAHLAIDRIHDEGGTNLDLGMLTGYEQLVRHQKSGQTNRIIMLTDALTNTGITDPLEMVKHSSYYVADFEVDFTIIGIGTDFNQELSRKLTGSARSSIFFINDEEDLKKVFIDEVESLISPIGRDVMLEVSLPSGMKALEIYGYDRTKGALKSNHIRIPLENLNGGLTMVALIKVELDKNVLRDNHKIEASLRYFDVHTQQSAQVAAHKKAGNLNGTSASVKKNFTIAEMAQGLQKMAQHYQKKEVKAAALAIDNALFKAENRFPDLNDEDIRRVYDILKKYQKDIKVLAQNNSEIQE